ncbi:unnamed protein product [Bemisia tabaci]|uniref:Brix domain-containing protein n=1 Tax=Bemisia tabaci TaxID=7038 RepID=A0A9P0AAB9_BEMTA|nr:unnamed protein product [Bemisia tabaci]
MGKRYKIKRKGFAQKQNPESYAKFEEPEELVRAPHSFVIHRGEVGPYIQELTTDFRKVMEPFTASSLHVRKSNRVKDFASVAAPLHVTHLCMFTNSKEKGPNLRIAHLPQGPTLTFKINKYTFARNVLSSLTKPNICEKMYAHSPLIVLNNFVGEGLHIKLMATMFQNMFPALNISKVNLKEIQRCVLINYDPNTETIEFRHYAIKVVPVGLAKGVKKLVQNKIPNLAKMEDISELITKPSQLSESEFEDDPNSHVSLPEHSSFRGGNVGNKTSSIRLSELGPRITFQLVKVEAGLLTGEVLYHRFVSKSEEEKERIRQQLQLKKELKARRRAEQEAHVLKKKALKELMDKKSLEGVKNKFKSQSTEEGEESKPTEGPQSEEESDYEEVPQEEGTKGKRNGDDEEDVEDAIEWFRKEVGEEPGEEFFITAPKRKRPEPPTTEEKTGKSKKSKKSKQHKLEDDYDEEKKGEDDESKHIPAHLPQWRKKKIAKQMKDQGDGKDKKSGEKSQDSKKKKKKELSLSQKIHKKNLLKKKEKKKKLLKSKLRKKGFH